MKDFHVRQCGNMKNDSRGLKLAVKPYSGNPGDLYLGIQQFLERVLIVCVHPDFDLTAIHKHAHAGADFMGLRVRHQIRRANRPENRDQLAKVLNVDQLPVSCGLRFGQIAMTEHCDVMGFHVGTEARFGNSLYQNAISGYQLEILIEIYPNGLIAVLRIQRSWIASEKGNRSFESDRKAPTGLGVGKSTNGVQRVERRGLRNNGSRGARENDRKG